MARRAATLAAVVLAALSCLSCSWVTDFAVVNTSESAVRVTYWLKEGASCGSTSAVPVETVARVQRRSSIGSLTAADIELSETWRPVRTTVDPSCRTVSLELEPGFAVRIAALNSYSRPDLDALEDFPVERLEISATGRTMKLCGAAVLVSFEGGRHQQLLVLRGSPAQMSIDLCRGAA